MDPELKQYHQEAAILHSKPKLRIRTLKELHEATSTISLLSSRLEALTAHKERKTVPLLASLKAIREDYAPTETLLKESILSLKQSLLNYHQEQQSLQKEVINNPSTSPTEKITLLSKQPSANKIATSHGSITFTSLTRYQITDPSHIPPSLLEINLPALKDYLKKGNPLPKGIQQYEEKSIRNYRK